VGYSWNPGGVRKEIACEGCTSTHLSGVDAAGPFLAPELKLVFPSEQFFAVTARYQWFLAGEREDIALFGFEVFAP
jgi:hypothetical protein